MNRIGASRAGAGGRPTFSCCHWCVFNYFWGSFRSGEIFFPHFFLHLFLEGLAGGGFGVVGLVWLGGGMGLKGLKAAEGAGVLAVKGDLIAQLAELPGGQRLSGVPRGAARARTGAPGPTLGS